MMIVIRLRCAKTIVQSNMVRLYFKNEFKYFLTYILVFVYRLHITTDVGLHIYVTYSIVNFIVWVMPYIRIIGNILVIAL